MHHGQQTRIEYDLLNRESRVTKKDSGITEPDGNTVQKNAYDRTGRLVRQTDGMDTGIEYAYNLAGDRVHFQTTGGATQELVYDAQGNITGVVDGNNNRTRYELDDWGRIAGIVKPDSSTESYLYDHAGNMTSSTDGEGNTTLYGYDLSGNVVSITDPTGEKELYVYEKEGRIAEKTDRNDITTHYAFNMYGAPLYRRVKDGIEAESYQYTQEGLMKAAISAGMHYSYEYDPMGRITRKSASGRTLLAYGYDLNGNLTTQRDVTGKVTEYTYNALDLIEKVTDNGTVTAEYSYYPDGSIRSLKNGNLYTEYAFDADKNLTGLKTTLGTEVLADNHYTYDFNGNRTEKRQINGTTRYTYDALNQLNKVQYPSYTEELYYDRAGNRTRRIAKGVEELYKYDPRNRLTEYTKGGVTTQFTYDNAGNLLRDDKAKYTYDAFNRTEKVETFDGHVQINRYDAEGLRHEMEEDGRLVQFIFRGDEIAAEEKDNSVIRYIRGYDLIASDAESARTYYHYASDEMSSITHIVGENQVLNHYEYDAWGNTIVCEETVKNRFRFNGQQYDPITQQYYLRARFYNPVIARFTQEDTYRGDGLNLYAYCANNPVYYEDPSGHACFKEILARVRRENPSMSETDLYKLAKETYWKEQYKEYRKTMSPQKALDAANYDRFYQENLRNNMSAENAAQRAQVDLEIHQVMQKYQMLTSHFDNASHLPSGKDRGTKVHKNVDKAMTDWIENRKFDYINVETEVYYKGGKSVNVKYWWQAKNTSRVDLHITEKADSNNPMIKPNRHIIGDIKTGSDSYKQEQMARNQANVATNAQSIGMKGGKKLYPEVNDPNVQHVQFKPVPQGQTMPRFEFGKNPQVGDYNVPGITEKRF